MIPRIALAYFHPNPAAVAALARDIAESGRFSHAWHESGSWLVCSSPVHGESDAPAGGSTMLESTRPTVNAETVAAALAASSPGPALCALAGDFSYFQAAPNGTLNVVRAVAGCVPVYMWDSGDAAAVATRLTDLVRFVLSTAELDPLPLAAWCAGVGRFPDRRTFLRGVRLLARGRYARWSPGTGWREEEYWRPDRIPTEARSRHRDHERAERLRSELVGNLEHSLARDGTNLLMLSGGVDSSCLAVLSADVVQRPFSTLTFFPPFRANLEEDAPFVDDLLSPRSPWIPRRWEVRLTREKRLELASAAPKLASLLVHPGLGALPNIARTQQVSVVYGGELADNLLGSAPTLRDWVANTTAWDMVRHPCEIPFGAPTARVWATQRARALLRMPGAPFPYAAPAFLRGDVMQDFHAWLSAEKKALARRPHPRAYLLQEFESFDGPVCQWWEGASWLGVRRAFPFLSRGMLELALECHPGDMLDRGPKRLLRLALRGEVPEKNLTRPRVLRWSVPEEWHPWEERVPEELASLVRPDFGPDRRWRLPFLEALRLIQLLNIVQGIRNQEQLRVCGARGKG